MIATGRRVRIKGWGKEYDGHVGTLFLFPADVTERLAKHGYIGRVKLDHDPLWNVNDMIVREDEIEDIS